MDIFVFTKPDCRWKVIIMTRWLKNAKNILYKIIILCTDWLRIMRKGQKLIKTVFHKFYSGSGEDASQLFNPFNLKTLDDEVIRSVIGHIHDMSDEEFDKIITTTNWPK